VLDVEKLDNVDIKKRRLEQINFTVKETAHTAQVEYDSLRQQ
jgi:hypothetical protein